MSQILKAAVAVVGIDIGKNSFHIVGHDERGAIVLRQKWSRGQVEARFANMPPCLIGMEACVGAHHLSRKLKALGHDARLMPDEKAPSSGAYLQASLMYFCSGVDSRGGNASLYSRLSDRLRLKRGQHRGCTASAGASKQRRAHIARRARLYHACLATH